MSEQDERLVVDAGVVVKWYVPETGSEPARRLLRSGRFLLAPDLLVAEIGNVLWKRVRRGHLAREDAEEIADTLLEDERVALVSSAFVMRPALRAALSFGLSVYDGLYVALALEDGSILVTADHRLVNALAGTPLARHVRLLGTF